MNHNEKVPFRLIECPECHITLCWVNPRLPNYCPECGKHIFLKLKFGGILAEAREAWLAIDMEEEEIEDG
jgi:ribosomal protein S27E